MRRVLLGAVAALMLCSACATATRYAPLEKGRGYSDSRIDETTFSVSFYANDLTPMNTVIAYLLYRSAELTVASGRRYFVMDYSSFGFLTVTSTTSDTVMVTTDGDDVTTSYIPGTTSTDHEPVATAVIFTYSEIPANAVGKVWDAEEVLRVATVIRPE